MKQDVPGPWILRARDLAEKRGFRTKQSINPLISVNTRVRDAQPG